jgi:hypothetical protein
MKIYLSHRVGRGYSDEAFTGFDEMDVRAFSKKEDAVNYHHHKGGGFLGRRLSYC